MFEQVSNLRRRTGSSLASVGSAAGAPAPRKPAITPTPGLPQAATPQVPAAATPPGAIPANPGMPGAVRLMNGTTATPPGAPPSPTGVTPGFQSFGPGRDLRYAEVLPQSSAMTGQFGGQLAGAAQSLTSAPDRMALAKSALADYDTAAAPGFQQRLQAVGRKAAALGRIGSGMATDALGDVQTEYERDRLLFGNGILREAASQTLGDRLGVTSALAGLYGQSDSMDRSNADATRGERAFQYGVGRDAVSDRVQQATLAEMLTQGQFGRGLNAAALGFGGNPSGALGAASAQTAAGAAGTLGSAADLFSLWAQQRAQRTGTGGVQTRPATLPAGTQVRPDLGVV